MEFTLYLFEKFDRQVEGLTYALWYAALKARKENPRGDSRIKKISERVKALAIDVVWSDFDEVIGC